MKYLIEYDICIDDDFPNDVCFVEIEADSKEEAVEKFRAKNIFKSVVIGVYKDGDNK